MKIFKGADKGETTNKTILCMGLPVDFLDVGIYDPVDHLEDRTRDSNKPNAAEGELP